MLTVYTSNKAKKIQQMCFSHFYYLHLNLDLHYNMHIVVDDNTDIK